MKEKEFNLIDEPWILAMDGSGQVKEIGLLECFRRAHELKGLAGELPTQDAAVLRLLLAILYAALSNTDADGKREVFAGANAACAWWKDLWERNYFPMEQISGYLRRYGERFWLFHPERPFFQVPHAQGTSFTAAKLLGDVSESANKPRLFSPYSRKGKDFLKNGEAARWLLYLNAFDDTSSKPSAKGKGRDSVGVGWLGRLGLVFAEGENLFETLLLNWVLVDPFNKEPYPADENACWEEERARTEERVKINAPRNPVSLLTLQSRRITLERSENHDGVTGFTLVHGDGFDPDNVFVENMTVWRCDKKEDVFRPRPFDPAIQLWRNFTALTCLKEDNGEQRRPPGVIAWISLLEERELIPCNGMIRIQSTGVEYGDKNFYVNDVFADSIAVNRGMLDDLSGNSWLPVVYGLLEQTADAVKALGALARDIYEAAGGSDKRGGEAAALAARQNAYFAFDLPFRKWLAGLDPGSGGSPDDKESEWLDSMRRIALERGRMMVEEAGRKALVGIDKKNGESSGNSVLAYNRFAFIVARITAKGGRQ